MPKKKEKVQTCNEQVLEETALKLGLHPVRDIGLIKEVVNAQAEFTTEKVRQGGFDGVMWPQFGKVKVKIGNVHYRRHTRDAKEMARNTIKPK